MSEHVGRRGALRMGGAAAVGAVGAGAALLAPQAARAQSTGLGYTPISPYRSVDTRAFGLPRIGVDEQDDWDLWTDQYGFARIPSSAGAVTFTLTVTQTQGIGFLAMWPASTGFPGISTINWVVGNLDLANGGTVALGFSPISGAGSAKVGCSGTPGTATHYLIDVTGYYS